MAGIEAFYRDSWEDEGVVESLQKISISKIDIENRKSHVIQMRTTKNR